MNHGVPTRAQTWDLRNIRIEPCINYQLMRLRVYFLGKGSGNIGELFS